jgi:alkanesulfonate monooxygenase SsuD/methylene tetrahydromethanopterin reductase-like flavin-dependent oxidoreductase (luciferase family)
VVGRGSFIESYPLFGFDLQHYDELFAEKLDLLLKLREDTFITWQGKHRPSLSGQGVFPRPVQERLPVRLGVGGTPQSFVRASMLGLPLTVAIIGGEPHRFRPLVDLYRQAWQAAGHDPAKADVAVHALGFLADTDEQAADLYWPAYEKVFTRIGKERGWGPITRRAFEQQLGPEAAFLIGSPATVEAKMQHYNNVLGGISRIGVHMSGGGIPHVDQMHAIELLGTLVER